LFILDHLLSYGSGDHSLFQQIFHKRTLANFEQLRNTSFIFVVIALFIVISVLSNMSVYTLDDGQVAIVKYLDRESRRVFEPGIHFKLPYVETIEILENVSLEVPPE